MIQYISKSVIRVITIYDQFSKWNPVIKKKLMMAFSACLMPFKYVDGTVSLRENPNPPI
jgi:hypothetical protein